MAMREKLKIFGVVLLASFSACSVMISTAVASPGLTSDGSVTLDGTEKGFPRLTAFGTSLACQGSTLTGHSPGTQEPLPSGAAFLTVTFDFKQEKCVVTEGSGNHKATVTVNGCDLGVRIGSTFLGGGGRYEAPGEIVCPSGNDIAVDVYPFSGSELGGVVCTMTIKPQTGLTGAIGPWLENTFGEPGKLTFGGTYEGIRISRSGAGCATEEGPIGQLDLNWLLSGTNAAGASTAIELSD